MRNLKMAVLLACSFLLASCHKDDETIKKDPLQGAWHLRHISGGLAGIDEDFERGSVTWTFDQETYRLSVENDYHGDAIYNGLQSATYPYNILKEGGDLYLRVDDREMGGILRQQNELVIDQNLISTGSGADGFVLMFEK